MNGSLIAALQTIADFPCAVQDNMPAANMRKIARDALDSFRQHAEQAEGAQGERIIQTAPERIYLIVGTECPRDVDFSELTEVSWCENDIDDGIEYVRADKAAALAQPSPEHQPRLVECDACPTSGGCVEVCMKAPAKPSPAPELERPESMADRLWQDYVSIRRRMTLDEQIDFQASLRAMEEQHNRIVGALREELETERMRLAGCGVAALGYFDGCADAYKSASLSDVLSLREKYDAAQARVAELEGMARSLLPWMERANEKAHEDIPELLRLRAVLSCAAAPVAQAGQVPEGWKLVPIDPTSQMTFIGQSLRYDAVNSIGEIYRQMIAAAPAQGGE